LPGFVLVGVVVLVDVEVDVVVGVVVDVEVDVVVGVVVDVEVDVVVGVVVDVEVDVVVGVVVDVVELAVVVEPVVEYSSARAELRPTDVAYPRPPSPTRGTRTANVTIATTAIRRLMPNPLSAPIEAPRFETTAGSYRPSSPLPSTEHRASPVACQSVGVRRPKRGRY
jgi:hypothetical protein